LASHYARLANNLYEYIIAKCKEEIPDVQTGIFGADMKISLVNDVSGFDKRWTVSLPAVRI